jgi:uncharacterized protein (DUF924 family)
MRRFFLTPTAEALPLLAAITAKGSIEADRQATGVLQSHWDIPAEARAVVDFWRTAGPGLWFAKNDDFDRQFRERFLAAHEVAACGEMAATARSGDGAMALVILLDQFPRNAFRGTSRMYATDRHARLIAEAAIMAGHDLAFDNELARFFYLPFAHSEDLADQERSVTLARRLGEPDLSHALSHRDIIRRFGRFPHRNPILGRAMTGKEQHYLENGGFKG